MTLVTLSPKYQVVIPLKIRKAMRLKPGQKLRAMRLNGHITLIPVRPMAEYEGFLPGIDTTVDREPDRL